MNHSKRLINEQKKLLKEAKDLESNGIYFKWDDNDITKVKAMIIGPGDSPYYGGFYFFDVTFPANYPMGPPKVIFKTGDNRTRIHPNLYETPGGKVCLSILGTWQGEPWTSSCSLRTVLVTIQSLMDAHPIRNEPGHERETNTPNDKQYNRIVTYDNIRMCVELMMKQTPAGFEIFKDDLERNFAKLFPTYTATLKGEGFSGDNEGFGKLLAGYDGKTESTPVWHKACNYKINDLIAALEKRMVALEKKGLKRGGGEATGAAGATGAAVAGAGASSSSSSSSSSSASASVSKDTKPEVKAQVDSKEKTVMKKTNGGSPGKALKRKSSSNDPMGSASGAKKAKKN